MKTSHKTAIGLGALAAAASALALTASSHGVAAARAEAPKVAGPARVDDFMLADQDLLGRQLYRMSDDKAVVRVRRQRRRTARERGELARGVER